jgi:DNA-binding GntR family transcriptional regulator
VRENVRPGPQHQALRSVISNPMSDSPELQIKVVKREDVDALPAELQGRHPSEGPFVWIRKIHFYSEVPFALIDSYVTQAVYRRFPKNGERRYTVPRLISDYGNVTMAVNDIEMSVMFADEESARLLNYTPAGALAKLRRWRTDPKGRVIMGSINCFRADMFVLDVIEKDQPFNIGSIRPSTLRR